jgi:spore germination protein KC
MRAIVVSDRLARKAPLDGLLEFFYRDAETRLDCPVIIAHGRAEGYMEQVPSFESVPSIQLASADKTASGFAGTSPPATLLTLALQLRGPTGSAALPYLAQAPPEFGRAPKFAGTAVIKGGLMIDRLQGKYGEGLLMLLDQYHRGVITIPCPSDAKAATRETVEIRDVRVTRKIDLTAGDVSVVYLAHTEARPLELACSAVDTPAGKKAYEKRVSAELKKRMEAALKRLQKDRADVTGIGGAVFRARPVLWRKWKEDWEARFASVKFRVKAAASLAPDAVAAGKPLLTNTPYGRR